MVQTVTIKVMQNNNYSFVWYLFCGRVLYKSEVMLDIYYMTSVEREASHIHATCIMGCAQTWEGVMFQMRMKTRTCVTITQAWTSAVSRQSW